MKINVSLDVNIYSELIILYQRLEEELIPLNPGCSKCGICCDFSKFDHVLYASGIEVNFIIQHIKVPDFNVLDNICPFLKDNQCSIGNFRMLGCVFQRRQLLDMKRRSDRFMLTLFCIFR